MKKSVILMLVLVLISIFLFAESGNKFERSGIAEDLSTIKSLPPRTNMMFAKEDITASMPIRQAEKQVAAEAEKQQPAYKLTLMPKEEEAELWIQAGQYKEALIKGLDLQIFNSSGERVYYSKLQSNFQKVSLCNYKGGKYVIKIGEQVYSMMII